jgi:cytochrome c556
MSEKTYRDTAKCPNGHTFVVPRRIATAGKTVGTCCRMCHQSYKIKAGPVPAPKAAA